MVEPMMIDLKALLVEREDCDAGTVQQLRNGLAQGGAEYRTLRDVTEIIQKKLESSSGAVAKRWHLKLGIASFLLGFTAQAVENLKQAEGALAGFYLGQALASRQDYDNALKAFEKAEKAGYTASQVQLQRAGIYRQKGELPQARSLLAKLEQQSSHNAEYHFQLASCFLSDGELSTPSTTSKRPSSWTPATPTPSSSWPTPTTWPATTTKRSSITNAAFKHPPVHVGTLKNLGVLYEDHEKYDKAEECYRRVLADDPTDEQARLFHKDAQASRNMYYSPEDDNAFSQFSQVLEIPVTDFELSVRSRNCLKKMNIKTLGDLTRVSEPQLLTSKNFGETSLTEIKEMLASKGLHIGQSLEEGAQNEMRFRPQQALSEQEQAILGKSVSELNLSVRAEVHEPSWHQHARRSGESHGRRTAGVEELRHDLVERSAREVADYRLIVARGLE